MKCLRKWPREAAVRAAASSGTARTGGLGAASGTRGEKIGLQAPTQRRSGVYYQPLETQKGNSGSKNPWRCDAASEAHRFFG